MIKKKKKIIIAIIVFVIVFICICIIDVYKRQDKYVVYMRIGYVYVVVIAAAALGSMLYGNDPSSAGQTIINFINNRCV